MPNNIIIVVGGSSLDVNVKELFENKGLLVEHYNARKSSDLKKQNIPKNTAKIRKNACMDIHSKNNLPNRPAY